MAVVVSIAERVRPVLPATADIVDGVAGVALSAGQAVYWNAAGNLVLSNAGAAGTAKFAGIALNTVGAGQGCSVLRRGYLTGYTLTALAYGAKAYLSNTAGALDDAAGTVSVVVGAVVPMSDATRTKMLYFDAAWLTML